MDPKYGTPAGKIWSLLLRISNFSFAFHHKKKASGRLGPKSFFCTFFLTATQFEKQQEVMKRGAAAAESLWMRGCGRRAKHLQLLSEADDYSPADLLRVGWRVRFPEHTESSGGRGKKKTQIIDLIFLKHVTMTTWTETCNTIQCTAYEICLHFSLISCYLVVLWNHTSQIRGEISAPPCL